MQMKIINCIMEFLDEATEFAFIRNQIEELRCRPFFKTDSYEEIKNSYREYIESDFKEIILVTLYLIHQDAS